MLTNTLITALLSITAVSYGVNAQSSTASSAAPSGSSIPGLTTCIVQCLLQAASTGGCSSFTDLDCICSSGAFQSAAIVCVDSECPTADQQTALGLQQQYCGSSASYSPFSSLFIIVSFH
ncbi:uncharacterized protein STEHIDRAFT_163645 [Stereum hirsutum FP-91666 SS1]|uniref:CFEM domain-containing protein n=1 Tax=Stereum hirsutum (strain FP-91666) TaxID=721885 RepID=R7RW19_STEHR|nr:uncharacterized protein STEHIDRAFT_163645 [Stereum hirsutum FP-91666 SS1]EIM79454.1 hypothetical protein STEHIDRAFT_163645 [Stereum hirsutum FP-91666 SS1]